MVALFFCLHLSGSSFIHSDIIQQMENKTKSVRAQINDLEVGGWVDLPLANYDYVVSCRTRLQTTTKKQFSSKIMKDDGVVRITRDEDKPETPEV